MNFNRQALQSNIFQGKRGNQKRKTKMWIDLDFLIMVR